LLSAIFADAQSLRMIGSKEQAAIDSTGFESTHRSSHYAWRMGRRYRMRKWPKITLVCHTRTHLIAVALMSVGPSQDSPLFEEALYKAVWHLDIDCLLADGGYDAEHNHVLAREGLGIRSTVINVNPRGRAASNAIRRRRWAKAKYRRQMCRRFHKRVYGQRWQIESVISRLKRRLGSALHGRSDAAKERDCHMKILTHDLMVLAAAG
jgi:transposase